MYCHFDGIVHALHIPLRLYLFPLGLCPFVRHYPVNSLAMATIVGIIYVAYFCEGEKRDAIYSIVYGWYAALFGAGLSSGGHHRSQKQL